MNLPLNLKIAQQTAAQDGSGGDVLVGLWNGLQTAMMAGQRRRDRLRRRETLAPTPAPTSATAAAAAVAAAADLENDFVGCVAILQQEKQAPITAPAGLMPMYRSE
jgi:hypothetical protein